ncbi:MAG: hypothetical protein OEY23_00195 [Acidimicrobiia bacterium]|nr:hypothetical protein [Acidimicrobiia bacterium]
MTADRHGPPSSGDRAERTPRRVVTAARATLAVAALALAGSSLPRAGASPVVPPTTPAAPAALFSPASSLNLVDTASQGPSLGPGEELTVPIVGGGTDSTAAWVQVTATASEPTFVTVWSGDDPRPATSTLNAGADRPAANPTVVAIGPSRTLRVYNHAGHADIRIDVIGWFGTGAVAGTSRLLSLPPTRLVDTRDHYRLAPGQQLSLELSQAERYQGVAALALTVTSTEATGDGSIAVGPLGATPVTRSPVEAGEIRSSSTVAALGPWRAIALRNDTTGWLHLVVDVNGVFLGHELGSGGEFHPVAPRRLLDTRADGRRLRAEQARTVPLGEPAGSAERGSALVNVTTLGADPASYLTVWATGAAIPGVSQAQTTVVPTATLLVAPVGADGSIQLRPGAGSADVVVDLLGWFTPGGVTVSPRPDPTPITVVGG